MKIRNETTVPTIATITEAIKNSVIKSAMESPSREPDKNPNVEPQDMATATEIQVSRLSPLIGANSLLRNALMVFGTADGKERRNTITATISRPNITTSPIAAKAFEMG